MSPILKVESREQQRIDEARYIFGPENVEVGFFGVGDYAYGNAGCEWKSDDFLNFSRLDKQSRQLINVYGIGKCFVVSEKSFGYLLDLWVSRLNDPNKLIGFVASLYARGVPVLFSENTRIAMITMKRVLEKMNDDKDRTIIMEKPIQTEQSDEVRALMGFGFSESLARDWLEKWTVPDYLNGCINYGDESRYRLNKRGLSQFTSRLAHGRKILIK